MKSHYAAILSGSVCLVLGSIGGRVTTSEDSIGASSVLYIHVDGTQEYGIVLEPSDDVPFFPGAQRGLNTSDLDIVRMKVVTSSGESMVLTLNTDLSRRLLDRYSQPWGSG